METINDGSTGAKSVSGIPTLILDANVLITLGQHPSNLKAIETISNAVDGGTYKLLVPEPIQNEFQRNKDKVAEAYWKTMHSLVKGLQQVRDALPDVRELDGLSERLHNEIDKKSAKVPETIQAVESLLRKGNVVRPPEAMKSSSADRIAQQKPPARKARHSSVNDCILWEIVKQSISRGPTTFVTDNSNDFSDKDKRNLDTDLVAELQPASKWCYHSLDTFREKHLQGIQIVVPPPAELFPGFPTCPFCNSPIAPDKIPRPSGFGGWSYHQYCGNCHRYIDTGDPYDE
jgi:hypothetical protein